MLFKSTLTALILYNVGTDEAEIIEVLKSHSLRQRLEIKDYYKQSFGKVCNRPLPFKKTKVHFAVNL